MFDYVMLMLWCLIQCYVDVIMIIKLYSDYYIQCFRLLIILLIVLLITLRWFYVWLCFVDFVMIDLMLCCFSDYWIVQWLWFQCFWLLINSIINMLMLILCLIIVCWFYDDWFDVMLIMNMFMLILWLIIVCWFNDDWFDVMLIL